MSCFHGATGRRALRIKLLFRFYFGIRITPFQDIISYLRKNKIKARGDCRLKRFYFTEINMKK